MQNWSRSVKSEVIYGRGLFVLFSPTPIAIRKRGPNRIVRLISCPWSTVRRGRARRRSNCRSRG